MVLDIESFRRAGYAAIDSICDYYANLEQRPVGAQVKPGFLAKAIPDAAPEEGEEWSTIEREYREIIMPGITHWQHPNFMAYYPCGTTFEGCLADLHAAAISNPAFNWSCSPSVTELELIMLDWLSKALHLSPAFLTSSEKGGAIILGSASEVAVTVAIAAREQALALLATREEGEREGKGANGVRAEADIRQVGLEKNEKDEDAKAAEWRGRATARLVMYGTTQTHSIGAKACLILGLAFRAIEVKAEDGYALRGEALRAAIEEDEAKGLVPFMLIATLGTTSSGATDNLEEIAAVANSHPTLWVHCDAAYAGVALALPEVREKVGLAAINEQFQSFSTNLHKWGLVQFDCSPLYVRDRGALSRALTITPEYLRTKHGDAGSVLDLRNMQISLGRRFRSLKMWFVLRSYGLSGFRAYLRSGIECANHFTTLLTSHGAPFALVAPPAFALVVFRLDPSSSSSSSALVSSTGQSAALDALNTRFWEHIQARSADVQLTQTVLPEVGFCLRLVVGARATEKRHVERVWEVLKECAERALVAWEETQARAS